MTRDEEILKLLYDLSAFNQLTERIVNIISDVFKVDAKGICRENGIVYFLGL